MNRTHRRFAIVATALVLCGIFTGCGGRARGGSDSETHFACTSDGYCRTLGPVLRCVEGYCKSSTSAGSTMASVRSSTDGGSAGTDAGASAVGTGTHPSAPPGALSSTLDGAMPGPWDQPLTNPITLTGTIVFSPGQEQLRGTNLWVALVWDMITDSDTDLECRGGAAREHLAVEQPVDIEIKSSGAFTIRISKTPPYAAFPHPATSSGVNETRGALLAYEDYNLNGRLDFSTPSSLDASTPSTSPADSVIGTSSPLDVDPLIGYPQTRNTYRLQYSDTGGGEFIPPRVPGYSIVHWADYEATLPENVALETSIPVPVDVGVAAQELRCSKVCLSTTMQSCPTHISELPPGRGEGRCTPPGAMPGPVYRWIGTTCSGCRCVPLECDFPEDVNGLESDWPCGADAGR